MESQYNEATYGEAWAEIYDDCFATYDEASIDLLAELANGGRALELGIGTGRIALPLASRGVEVHGIDASPAMVERLKQKQPQAAFPITIGNFADVAVEGEFALIYIVFNTFFGLLSQEEQVRCFANVARRLTPDGVFLIEAFVPDVTRFEKNSLFRTSEVGLGQVALEAARHDPMTQRIVSERIVISESGTRLYPVQVRYAWPAELDLMAQLVGLRLRDRWSGWRREPFTAQSTQHVSVYGK